MSKSLYLIDVLNYELGLNLSYDIETTISSPFRRDSNPSFRVYGITTDGIDRGAYDWGTGKSYNAISFIMEYKGLTYSDALKYLASIFPDFEVKSYTNPNNKIYELFKWSEPVSSIDEALLLEKAILDSTSKNEHYLLLKHFINRWVFPL